MNTTATTYRLRLRGGDGGMYTYGNEAATPAIARKLRGTMRARRPGETLVVEQLFWVSATDGRVGLRLQRSVAVEVVDGKAEPEPGCFCGCNNKEGE